MSNVYRQNPDLVGFQSLAGGALLPVGDYPGGCPEGRAAGRPTSVAAVYAERNEQDDTLPPAGSDMSRWGAYLPYLDWPSLGEGGTPLIELESSDLGKLWIKAEWMNPTGSHKDRMSPLAAARAVEVGASGIVCASSGNAGVSIACYAAKAGLASRVIVTASLPKPVRRALATYGADVVVAENSLDRWRVMEEAVKNEGWFPLTNYLLPPVGSCAWGVEGYKTVAFELAAECSEGLDAVIVPTARGDIIWGIAAGFAMLAKRGQWHHPLPKLIAVEPFPRISKVLDLQADITDQFPGSTRQASIAGTTATDQSLRAVVDTGGTALVISDDMADVAQHVLAQQSGIYLELCAAAPYAAIPRLLAQGHLARTDRVVMIGTSAGYRDPVAVDATTMRVPA
ncbi:MULTISPECIES: threonine synthase [Burkholderia]|uniref:threonine synthase n=1 Tax=Burkholderia TaxID=32008 RepID=UPI000F5AE163|nr:MULTISPECIES: pyridoxal-phosphate dependent enzyme [Burkholderia]MCW3638101.1 pyridoxal-phosphate dependent enzyme [Burkholderia cenocepacia]RQU61185.1 pyridoxal-phosphate dependent enzyme [Burkholderia cenocepacia]RQV48624.1 pyridoxal-phosphate dependent enzyme [Burkholderia cenocepacia]RQZ25579.1 pyridoxal-phosphate dependent enzyme [Burkholderia sp. Bp9090]